MVDLASEIAAIVGFTYKIVLTNGYGSIGKDGRWEIETDWDAVMAPTMVIYKFLINCEPYSGSS